MRIGIKRKYCLSGIILYYHLEYLVSTLIALLIANVPEMTPEEVAITFYFLLNEGEYQEAEMLLSQGGIKFLKTYEKGDLEWFSNELFSGWLLNRIEVGEIEIWSDEAVIHSIIFFFTNGSKWVYEEGIELEREDGEWKMEELY